MNKIGLLGPYGYGNLGDAAIQQAMIDHIRTLCPEATVYGFSLNPGDTEKRHGIPSYLILRMPEKPDSLVAKIPARIRNHFITKILVRFFLRMPNELVLTFKSFRVLSNFDLLIVSGGGQLDDYWGGAWSHPYTLFKWGILARLRKTKYIFVSVGAGPIDSLLSRIFIRGALSLADYRSYRDENSKRFIRGIGFRNDEDPVYPDLAYSFQVKPNQSPGHQDQSRPIIGIGPMAYFDPRVWPERDNIVYTNYLKKLAAFVAWLLKKRYRILLFPGGSVHDRYAIQDLKNFLKEERSDQHHEIMDPPIETVDALINHLLAVDIVVASRLHGVLLSHVIYKPVLAISYHDKIDSLMRDLGQAEYCLNIDNFEVEDLKKRFAALESGRHLVQAQIVKKMQRYRQALSEQYERIVSDI
jgi:polysaccharide pyruvyl transferase WcaK-like protein